MSTEPIDPELNELERRLSAMTPAPAAVSRDRLMFRAGQAAETRRRRRHAGTSLVLGVLGLTAGFVLGRTASVPSPVVRTPAELATAPAATVPIPPVASVVPPAAAESPAAEPAVAVEDVPLYLTRRFGLGPKLLGDDAKPASALPAVDPPPPMPLEELLGLPVGSLDDAQRQRWESALHPGDPS